MGKNDNDNDGPALSDEEWARFMEQAQADAGRAPREPSARARMVTARLQGESGEPPGWRTGPAWREREGRGGASAGSRPPGRSCSSRPSR